jgi:hypothetical protein
LREESFEIERTMFRVIYHTAMSTSIDLAAVKQVGFV